MKNLGFGMMRLPVVRSRRPGAPFARDLISDTENVVGLSRRGCAGRFGSIAENQIADSLIVALYAQRFQDFLAFLALKLFLASYGGL